jgi:hypothetical protein
MSAWTAHILTEVSHCLRQIFRAYSVTAPSLSHDRFLPNPFQFIMHLPVHHLKLQISACRQLAPHHRSLHSSVGTILRGTLWHGSTVACITAATRCCSWYFCFCFVVTPVSSSCVILSSGVSSLLLLHNRWAASFNGFAPSSRRISAMCNDTHSVL